MKSTLFAVFVLLGSLFANAEPGKISLRPSKSLDKRQIDPSLSFTYGHEYILNEVISKWGGGSLIADHGLTVRVGVSDEFPSNAQFARGQIVVLLGNDIGVSDYAEVFATLASHEMGHVVFERFSGINGFSTHSVFGDFVNFIDTEEKEKLVLYLNELFADVFSFYMSGKPRSNVLLRGELFDFSKSVQVKDVDPHDEYQYFLPSRKAIFDRFMSEKQGIEDLYKYYRIFVELALALDEVSLKTLNTPKTLKALNLKLQKKLSDMDTIPLPGKCVSELGSR